MTDPSGSFERVGVAALLTQRSRADRAALLDELVEMLTGLVQDVRVERTMLRRQVTAVHIPLGEFVYVLARGPNDSMEASRRHMVRRVVVRTVPLDLPAFLEELGLAIEAELGRTDAGRVALERWLRGSDQ